MSESKPLVLIIMDGYGLRDERNANAIKQANTPNIDRLWNNFPHTKLGASGLAVGLPDGQMGNSEVGHLNIGAGRTVYQDLTRISKAIEEGSFFNNEVFLNTIKYIKDNHKKLHLYGLLSDGGVHSHINHLFALLDLAKKEGLQEVYIHVFLDGRDVAPDSSIKYIKMLQEKIDEIGVGKIATVQGRYYAMDRDNRWERTEKSYRSMVYGEGNHSDDLIKAILESYEKEVFDEFMIPTVLVNEEGQPITTISSGDAIIFFNFRPDRAIQISQAFINENFQEFDRGVNYPKDLYYVSLTQYSRLIDGFVAYKPTNLDNTIGDVIMQNGLKQLRIAETEKYPHVTYFFSGGCENRFDGEERILIPSPKVATYDLKPEMSAYEITEVLLMELKKDIYDVVILNYANCDMVGHSGKMSETIKAVEAVDDNVGKIIDQILSMNGVAILTADHGNADLMCDINSNPITAHSTSPVPLIITKKGLKLRDDGILADVAPTMLELLGIDIPSEMTGKSLIK